MNQGSCLDMVGDNSFWNLIPRDRCRFDNYGLLYKGYANRMTNVSIPNAEMIYTVSTQDVTFGLTTRRKESVCGYTLIKTKHPRLFIFETQKGNTFVNDRKISSNNLDLFSYVNSKLVYVECHIRTQIENLYRDIQLQRCDLERQALLNSLSMQLKFLMNSRIH